jgi:hypothetical protein
MTRSFVLAFALALGFQQASTPQTPQQWIAQIKTDIQALEAALAAPALPSNVFGPAVPTAQIAAPLAYPTARQDRVPLAPSLPALPAAGGTFVDPAFNRAELRVTDANLSGGKSWRLQSSEAGASWGRASDRFFLERPDGTVRLFKMLNGAPALTSGIVPFTNEPTFSRVSPAVLYGATGFRIQAEDTDTFTVTTLVDVAAIDPAHAKAGTYLGGSVQSSASVPERLAYFYGGAGQDRHFLVSVFEAQNPSKRLTLDTQAKTLNGQPIAMDAFFLHAIGIDQSGRYVILYPASPVTRGFPHQMYVWDVQAATVTAITDAMFPYGHTALGYGVMVNADSGNVSPYDAFQYQVRSLAALDQPRAIILPPLTPKLVYGDDHPNWTNARADAAAPFITATYRHLWQDTTPLRAMDGEIGAVDTITGAFYRFAKHYSDVFSDVLQPDGARVVTFWYQPIPQVSPDGRYVVYHSNMGKTLGPEPGVTSGPERYRTDVFLIDVSR